MGIFWRAFKDAWNDDFEEAVSYLIANQIKPPMLDALSKQVEFAKVGRNQRYLRQGSGSISEILQSSAQKTQADPEFVKMCTKMLREKLTAQLKREQFYQGCDLLDQTVKAMR